MAGEPNTSHFMAEEAINPENIKEVEQLKSKIRRQVNTVSQLNEEISAQAEKLNEMTPENVILKKWIEHLTHFTEMEIEEIIKMEKYLPGTIEAGVNRSIQDFQGNTLFIDFVEAAKSIAVIILKDKVAAEQLEILKNVKLDAIESVWGKVREYDTTDLDLVPQELQDLFGKYLYDRNQKSEEKFIEKANVVYALYNK